MAQYLEKTRQQLADWMRRNVNWSSRRKQMKPADKDEFFTWLNKAEYDKESTSAERDEALNKAISILVEQEVMTREEIDAEKKACDEYFRN